MITSFAEMNAISNLHEFVRLAHALGVDFKELHRLEEKRLGYAGRDRTAMWEGYRAFCNGDEVPLDLLSSEPFMVGYNFGRVEEQAARCPDLDVVHHLILDKVHQVEFRDGWHGPGQTPASQEFRITLKGSAPWVRIEGQRPVGSEEVDRHSIRYVYGGYGTPRTEKSLLPAERAYLLSICCVVLRLWKKPEEGAV